MCSMEPFYIFFYVVLLQAASYCSCLAKCYNAIWLWSSRRLQNFMWYSIFGWTYPLNYHTIPPQDVANIGETVFAPVVLSLHLHEGRQPTQCTKFTQFPWVVEVVLVKSKTETENHSRSETAWVAFPFAITVLFCLVLLSFLMIADLKKLISLMEFCGTTTRLKWTDSVRDVMLCRKLTKWGLGQ